MTTLWGFDYASWRPSNATLKSNGVQFVCRYLSNSSWKNLTKAEANNLKSIGIDIVSNWEGDGNAEVKAGKSSGIANAKAALKQHNACGGPDNAAIYFSVDYDANPSTVIPYIQGAVSVLGYDRVGVYGSYKVIEAITGTYCKYGWQTYAWSGGKLSSKAHIYQYQNGVLNGQADRDKTLKDDFGSWNTGGDNVALTDADIEKIAEKVWRSPRMPYTPPAKGETADLLWPQTFEQRTQKKLDALVTAVAALNPAGNVDAVAVANQLASNQDFINKLAKAFHDATIK